MAENITHLWEVDHPYYCNEGNYDGGGSPASYSRWQDFIADMADADFDLNLLFRFDWEPPRDDNEVTQWRGDENYRDCTLKLFFMGQRKGKYWSCSVQVCRADEPAVREYLIPRLDYLLRLWEPLAERKP